MAESWEIDIDNKEFKDALSLIQFTSQSVFLTGKAGTGKSTFLKYICAHTRKKHIILAPTGVAAINAGGSTIHSFFKMPFRPILPDDPDLSLTNGRIFEFLKYTKKHRQLIREVELVIIDEISMVRADMVDFIDRVLRVFSGNMRLPFGGKQLLFVGDIFQLEPVVTSDTRDILSRFYKNAFFFSARVFSEISLVPIELRKVYRQSDERFVHLLDKIRSNTVSDTELKELNNRYKPMYEPVVDDFSITLATRRDQVDYINDKRLSELDEDKYFFEGEIKGDFPEGSLPTPLELELKKGAQVIFIKNDTERRWVNGTVGLISDIADDRIFVVLETGEEYEVERDVWENIRYTYNEKEKRIEEKVLGTFIQFPLRLAWAITVHKSQGLTFNRVIVDFTGGAFAGGQTYVALSRCVSLEGIVLKKEITPRDIFINPEIVKFSQSFNDRQLIERSLKLAQADRLYKEASFSFDKGDFDAFLRQFFEAIHSRYDIEKPNIKRFIRKKLNIITRLKEENRMLREKLYSRQEMLQKYAYEYYLLGNECITKAHDTRAALANFDKALSLDPMLVDAWVRKGVTLADVGEYNEAAGCFNEAVRLSPRYFKALYNRGKLRYKLEDFDGAVSDLSKSVDLKPQNATAHDRLGDAFSKLGNVDMATRHWVIAETLRENKQRK
ncbi:tetratricopeptide repeat protein [Barnesiella propionica]|uniref:tetratricopeptide repeat protein n=1 Tax=Barnesiella propionica TaxID=2981781 RepID=UPI0011C70392|nr:tetratricopeptide repeat protein [Barnesiella propionica]MCU6767748.1 tetratricopeptide repeat protein [Barnesiella propionica]